MGIATIEPIPGGKAQRYTFGAPRLSYAAFLERLREDESFREDWIELLAEAPFAAYCWETPPVKRCSIDRPFEFMLLAAPSLSDARPEPGPFRQHFANASDREVVVFPNLGGDAVLLAPTPRANLASYPHLAAFSRLAPRDQQHTLWQVVGEVMQAALGDQPIWLSTAGTGVYWLHLRLDSYPKYYIWAAYRRSADPSTENCC